MDPELFWDCVVHEQHPTAPLPMPPKAPLQLLAREPLSSDDSHHGGTGTRFGNIVITLAGVAALVASLITAVYVQKSPHWLAVFLVVLT